MYYLLCLCEKQTTLYNIHHECHRPTAKDLSPISAEIEQADGRFKQKLLFMHQPNT